MRSLIGLAVIGLLAPPTAFAEDIFGGWMIFPGPNPGAADLLPDADPDTVFRIGQILFEHPFEQGTKTDRPVKELAKLQPVADVVEVARPGPALTALVDQQLDVPHAFRFEKATVLDHGNAGITWHVTYALYPKQGGFSGIPFRYRAVLDGRGNLISPRLSVFDAYFHSATRGWTCSVLQLPTDEPVADPVLSAEKIRDRATESLERLEGRSSNGDPSPLTDTMKYESQDLVPIPVATAKSGEVVHMDVWAVSFRDTSRKERPDELFTVWVTTDGRPAKILHLDHWWCADEPNDAPESR